VHNVERLRKAELLWQCPAGSYPCNATSAGALCVERHRWCDHVADCPNEEDEDPEHCCQYIYSTLLYALMNMHDSLTTCLHARSTFLCIYATYMHGSSVRKVLEMGQIQGRSDGGYIGIYTPKISPSRLYGAKMTSKRLLPMSIKLYLPQKFYTPKQISGYAPGEIRISCEVISLFNVR